MANQQENQGEEFEGVHNKLQYVNNNYSHKMVVGPNEEARAGQVPHYPRPVEFRVTEVAHVTLETGLEGIMGDGGFRGGKKNLLSWGLLIGEEEIDDAEQRYVETLFPDRTPDEKKIQKEEPFLHRFTTSSAFKEESRYGNFRFSFSLAYVLQKYSIQVCGGKRPVFRIYNTTVYRQPVEYTVLIHSPDVHDYDDYPKLRNNDEGVCAYRDGEIIWRAQAISQTHTLKLVENQREKLVQAEDSREVEFYVWDHVALAFHMPAGTTLSIPHQKLLKALTACGPDYPPVDRRRLMKKAPAERIVHRKTSNMES